ncbi:MAG: hypothetical protein FWD90_13885 [Defluviitaleaceae bacterium]|nr:hypothetical protein [Defluviitaleaceae bacterium]
MCLASGIYDRRKHLPDRTDRRPFSLSAALELPRPLGMETYLRATVG